MPIQKKIVDPIRVKILSAMTKSHALTPNVRYIKKLTGFHRATIKSSINFLEESGFIKGYRPLLDPIVAGLRNKIMSFLNVDVSQKNAIHELINLVKEDPTVLRCSEVITDHNANFAITSLSKSSEDYYNNFKNYYYSSPKIQNLIKERKVYYFCDPIYKSENEIDITIKLLEKELGVD